MNRVGIFGLGALLGRLFSSAIESPSPRFYGGARGGDKYQSPFYGGSNPKGARWWHVLDRLGSGDQPDSVRQLRLFTKAQAKRDRRAEKLEYVTVRGMLHNKAHRRVQETRPRIFEPVTPARLNPFYQRPVTE